MVDYVSLGARIRAKRKICGLTQAELAEKACISLSFVGHIERGSRKASLETLIDICNILKTSPTYLLQDSLVQENNAEAHASRMELLEELSTTVIEKLIRWSEKE